MVQRGEMMDTKKITHLGLLTCLALIIFIVELRIPDIVPVPGVKLGLANIVTVYCVYNYRPAETAMMLYSRILLGALFSGNLIRHPAFDQIRGTNAYRVVGNLDNTDYVMNNSFWIGVYPGMTDEMLDYMAQCIIEAIT